MSVTTLETIRTTREIEQVRYRITVTCDHCKITSEPFEVINIHMAVPDNNWQMIWTRYDYKRYCPICLEARRTIINSPIYNEALRTVQQLLELFPEEENDEGGYTYTYPTEPDTVIELINNIGKYIDQFKGKLE